MEFTPRNLPILEIQQIRSIPRSFRADAAQTPFSPEWFMAELGTRELYLAFRDLLDVASKINALSDLDLEIENKELTLELTRFQELYTQLSGWAKKHAIDLNTPIRFEAIA